MLQQNSTIFLFDSNQQRKGQKISLNLHVVIVHQNRVEYDKSLKKKILDIYIKIIIQA